MPLLKLEELNKDCMIGLWEIGETQEELTSLLKENLEPGIEQIISEEKKLEKMAARILLKYILNAWGEDFHGTFSNNNKKPYLVNSPYSISLSHSHKKAVAIIRKNDKIGIDIELIQEKIVNIAQRVFTKEELDFTGVNLEKLTLFWSIKEVLYKIDGERGIDFKKNLFIPPFKFLSEGGLAKGIIKTTSGVETYNIKYLRHENHIVAFNI